MKVGDDAKTDFADDDKWYLYKLESYSLSKLKFCEFDLQKTTIYTAEQNLKYIVLKSERMRYICQMKKKKRLKIGKLKSSRQGYSKIEAMVVMYS